MRSISLWAKSHIWQARMLIVTSYLLLNIIGIYTGRLLKDINVMLPEGCFSIATIIFISIWILYPSGKHSRERIAKKISYTRRKSYDVILISITFVMIVYAGNNSERLFLKTNTASAAFIIPVVRDTSEINNPLIKNFVARIKSIDVSKLSQREKIRMLKNQVRIIKHDKALSKAEKTLLIILSIIVACSLFLLVGALSCNIACAGSEGLSILVLLAGTFLIVFLLVRIIKRINHPRVQKNGMIARGWQILPASQYTAKYFL